MHWGGRVSGLKKQRCIPFWISSFSVAARRFQERGWNSFKMPDKSMRLMQTSKMSVWLTVVHVSPNGNRVNRVSFCLHFHKTRGHCSNSHCCLQTSGICKQNIILVLLKENHYSLQSSCLINELVSHTLQAITNDLLWVNGKAINTANTYMNANSNENFNNWPPGHFLQC